MLLRYGTLHHRAIRHVTLRCKTLQHGFETAGRQSRHHVDVPIMSTTVQTADSVRDLGIIVDSYLTMAPHVSAVC